MKYLIEHITGDSTPSVVSETSTQDPVALRPEFLRLPKAGSLCRVTGLSRSYLNSLILPVEANSFSPPVRSVCIRKRGARKGVRLISYDSLIAFLRNNYDGTAKHPSPDR